MEANEVLKSLRERIEKVNGYLLGDTGWRDKFNEHIDKISHNDTFFDNATKKYRIKASTHLFIYSSISSIKKSSNKCRYDIRYSGQSVATIELRKEENNINAYISTKGKEKNNKRFRVDPIPQWSEWKSKEVQRFRKQFKDCEVDKGHSPEHALENKLLYEFSKSARKQNKLLCNIQPVRLGGYFFQMVTPFSASRNELKYNPSYKGGGIDILARIKTKRNECKLVIFELKDENKAAEPPRKVIMQAVTYAAFMGHLLADEEQGEKWWKLGIYILNNPMQI